jgi:oligopeptide transport system permease protein
MTRGWARLLRDLSLLPLTALLVYLLVMNLPYRQDTDSKMATGRDERALRTAALGDGGPLDAWVPWSRLAQGRSVSLHGVPFTPRELGAAVGLSGTIGLVALALALLWALAFAFVRVRWKGGAASVGLELLPAIVFGSPAFLLALVAVLLAQAAGVDFNESVLLAAVTMAVGPGTFVGVVLSDALEAERARPYFVTALAKGCTPTRALLHHALPNALPALLDAVGPVATSLLAGSFVAESFFRLQGFAFIYLDAARTVEPGVVVVATTLFAALLIAVSMAVELARRAVDPRARQA